VVHFRKLVVDGMIILKWTLKSDWEWGLDSSSSGHGSLKMGNFLENWVTVSFSKTLLLLNSDYTELIGVEVICARKQLVENSTKFNQNPLSSIWDKARGPMKQQTQTVKPRFRCCRSGSMGSHFTPKVRPEVVMTCQLVRHVAHQQRSFGRITIFKVKSMRYFENLFHNYFLNHTSHMDRPVIKLSTTRWQFMNYSASLVLNYPSALLHDAWLSGSAMRNVWRIQRTENYNRLAHFSPYECRSNLEYCSLNERSHHVLPLTHYWWVSPKWII